MVTKTYLLIQFRKKSDRSTVEVETLTNAFNKVGVEVTLTSISALKDEPLPNVSWSDLDFSKYDGVILGGSEISFDGDSTCTSNDLAEHIAKVLSGFIKQLVKSSTPSLAICFGHQVFANIFSTEIHRGLTRGKSGAYKVTLTESGLVDPLFRDMPSNFYTNYMHQDVLAYPPTRAKILADGERCRYGAMLYGTNSYTLQFHPELSREDLKDRLMRYPQYLEQGKSVEEVLKDVSTSTQVLSNFAKL